LIFGTPKDLSEGTLRKPGCVFEIENIFSGWSNAT